MEYDGISKKLMKIFRERLVVRKSELIEFIKDDVGSNPGNPRTVVDAVTKTMVQKGLITPIYASTFAVTQRGMNS
jgi:hypothetical protein